MRRKLMLFTLLCCLTSIISSCGQSGKLYLPEQQTLRLDGGQHNE